MSRNYVFEPDWVVSPGEVLEDVLDEKGMTWENLSEKSGLSLDSIQSIRGGETVIDDGLSFTLSRALGYSSPDYWKRLQNLYNKDCARLASSNSQYRLILETKPIKDLIARGFIVKEEDATKSVDNVLSFFGVTTVPALRKMYSDDMVSLRHSEKVVGDPLALACWLRCCELEAEKVKCGKYDRDKFKEALNEARSMTVDMGNDLPQRLQELCASCGVVFVVVEEFKGCATNGAVIWDEADRPVLMVNLRGKRADIFWFTFFHEAAHILFGDKRRIIEGLNEADDAEVRANEFSQNILIPDQYKEELKTLTTEESIVKFAKKVGVHPGIVVGRLQYEKIIPQKKFNKLKMKVMWVEG